MIADLVFKVTDLRIFLAGGEHRRPYAGPGVIPGGLVASPSDWRTGLFASARVDP